MIAKYWKALASALTLIGTNLSALAADPSVSGVLPSNITQWLTLAGTTVLGTVAVYLSPKNLQTISDAEDSLRRAKEVFAGS